jgi:uncharacterized membrane protein YkvA (DUF1232 family)
MKFSIQALYNWYRNLLRNPKYRWWVVLGTIVYLVSPLDIAPDFLPIIGEIDDVLLLTLLVSELSGLVVEQWRERKANVVDTGTPDTTQDSTSTPETIDVNATHVK